MTPPDVVVFDGVCNLCSRSVQFILKHEAEPRFRFAPVQSPAGSQLLRDAGFDSADVKTFVLLSHGTVYTRSSAALRIAKSLKGPWKLLRVAWLVPRPIRDWMYDLVARNRYRWFGKTDTCMVPTPELRERFLHD
jgi:predicted DCC family thiol-disulfide oxidoreductase YuxK